ncbi:glycosyltransferase [Pseudomonadota bacterium]
MSSCATICILAPAHRYDDVRIFQKEATTLAKSGYRVFLLARADEEFVENSVQVVPVQYRTRLHRFLLQPWLLYKVLSTRAELVHLHNPDTLPIGFVLKLFGKRVIYDTHENFPLLIPRRRWVPTVLRKPLAKSVDLLERAAGHVFDSMVVTQTNQLGSRGKHAVLIGNPPIMSGPLIEEAFRLATGIDCSQQLRLVYAGSISEDRGLLLMVQVLDLLNHRLPARLWLAGPEADPGVIEQARQLPGWRYVDYMGNLSQQRAFSHIAAADIGLILFLPRGDHEMTNPNKLFEYQMLGTPFVASAFAEWKRFTGEADAGLFVDPGSIEIIVGAIEDLARDRSRLKCLAENGQKFIRESYNWELESQKLLTVYERLTGVG